MMMMMVMNKYREIDVPLDDRVYCPCQLCENRIDCEIVTFTTKHTVVQCYFDIKLINHIRFINCQ